MKSILTLTLVLGLTLSAIADNIDTVYVKPENLNLKALQTGDYGYLVFGKKNKKSPATHIALIKFEVESGTYHNKPAFVIKQQWESDTVIHVASSIFDAKDFTTIVHDTWWKQLGYSMKIDFEHKKINFINVSLKGGIPDSVKSKSIAEFNDSFKKYNLNWHADLIVYQMLPYKENRSFVINYYDPGFGKSEEVTYSVTGSDFLTSHNGEKIDCWILNHNEDNRSPSNGYERYWISKKTSEVLKEEDFGKKGSYRYKIKLGISGDN